jgi:hypothetical protein
MKMKSLKLPDGGTFQLQTPPEFGAPILALNGAGSAAFGATDLHRSPVVVYGIGIGLGLLAAYLWLNTGKPEGRVL